jgi:hypothetical protein
MSKTNTVPIPQSITNFAATIVNATSFSATNPGTAPTNTVLVTTANSNDSVIKSLTIASDDSSARTVQIWMSLDNGTTKYLVGTVVVAALSGTATLTNIDFLGNTLINGLVLDETGKPVLPIGGTGTPIKIYACVITAAVTASKTIWITGVQMDY